MAESNQEPKSMEAFRAKKASPSTFDKPTASSSKKALSNASIPSASRSNSPQASASQNNSSKRSASAENLAGDRFGPGLDQRQNKVKLLREKQADERRRKNEERRAAFEERKKKKEEEEKERWASLKEQASRHGVSKANTSASKPGSGRKLPSVPSDGTAKRPGTAVESLSRPSSLPKPLNRPASANLPKSPSRHSADSLSPGSTPKQSPAVTPSGSHLKTSLPDNKSVSAGNLISATNRRPNSGSSQPKPSSGTKSRARTSSQTAQTLEKPSPRNSLSHESLLLPGGKLTKSHSTSSLHKVGHHKPTGDKSHKTEKAETKPKAGVTDEATAKQALAERRKKAREEAERQAALDKERQEAERLKREEEERIRAEEEAKEEARMRELAELLRKQEEERLRLAAEEKERRDREEAERAAAEKKRKEEEEQRAREEEERKAQEDEERRKQEEAERLERKRVTKMMFNVDREVKHHVFSKRQTVSRKA
ncbi:PREDICTED: MAP7 domain-containing protein 2-like [Acropora digitifera]|uniref:MAP7 domain-containing protein 2-like n=1 Tax=Acropora digitifera TaxID=70779 RepID=UPI00077AD27E|nr:PREDICTED: MAP7 domain-containing protein 2-like [Acropora digitifera]